MITMKKFCLGIVVLLAISSAAQDNYKSPVPSKKQQAWHETEFYLFMHFGPNTFTDKEWGTGTEPEAIFNPTQLDCKQWCSTAKAAGAKGIIITAKHHDGFCLWPSNFSTHTVRESKWKDGKGDVLKELSQACREAGLKFGVYLSPWDRNHPDYGTDKYNTVFAGMMKEIFLNYGPIWEMWWDGANGEGPNGKIQEYDWKRYENIVKQYSPNTVVFSDIGPDIRWVGNENGIAGDPNWNFLDPDGFKRGEGAPPTDTLNQGNYRGRRWMPAECDVSIRPGWFWHANEDDKIKTPRQLFDIYIKSVGRGALVIKRSARQQGADRENEFCQLFIELNREFFHKLGVEFGMRTIRQGLHYLALFKDVNDDPLQPINNFLLHKVLPKFTFDGNKTVGQQTKLDLIEKVFTARIKELLPYYEEIPEIFSAVAALENIISDAKANDGVVNFWS